MGDFHALWRLGQICNPQRAFRTLIRNIENLPPAFDEEVMVI